MSHTARDGGFTLIEIIVTIALMGVLMAIAVSGWSGWAASSAQSGTARELQSLMRQTQQRAVTEGNAFCVDFDTAGNQFAVFEGACTSAAKTVVRGPSAPGARVRLASPSFGGGTSTGVTFYSRGTATPGSVKVTRDGSTKTYTLTVEALTGRVALS